MLEMYVVAKEQIPARNPRDNPLETHKISHGFHERYLESFVRSIASKHSIGLSVRPSVALITDIILNGSKNLYDFSFWYAFDIRSTAEDPKKPGIRVHMIVHGTLKSERNAVVRRTSLTRSILTSIAA